MKKENNEDKEKDAVIGNSIFFLYQNMISDRYEVFEAVDYGADISGYYRRMEREVTIMRSQEMAIYREIQKNTEKAMAAIDTISDKVYDDQLAMQISRQALKYSEIHNKAVENLLQAKAELYHANNLSDMVMKGSIHYNTLLNTSTGHIAEMMIKGSNMGVLEINKVLNHNEEIGQKPKELAKELIEFEGKNVERLMKYL